MPADKDADNKPENRPTSKFATTLSELENALQAWDDAVAREGSTKPAAADVNPNSPLYDTKLIKDLCRQLRELSKE